MTRRATQPTTPHTRQQRVRSARLRWGFSSVLVLLFSVFAPIDASEVSPGEPERESGPAGPSPQRLPQFASTAASHTAEDDVAADPPGRFALERLMAQFDCAEGERALAAAMQTPYARASIDLLRIDHFWRANRFIRHTPLQVAVFCGREDWVRFLLRERVEVERPTLNGWTALIIAASLDRREIARLLLQAGARVDARDRFGQTALMACAWADAGEMAHLLIAAGAAIDARDAAGRDALLLAAALDAPQLARQLLAAGVQPDTRLPDGRTALALAEALARTGRGEEIRRLLDAAAHGQAPLLRRSKK